METLSSNITSRVIETKPINWRELKFIQNENFKELTGEAKHKLKASIVSNNFMQPFYVWEDDAGTRWCLDGKHRSILLEELINEGAKVPYELPVTFIQCANKQQASRLVLLFSSQYARITQEGLHDFITLNDLDFADLREQIDIPDFSELRYEQKFGFQENAEEMAPAVDVEGMEIVIKPGDIIRLDDHTIFCGSFRDPAVQKLLENQKARIVLTDPPYNLPMDSFTNLGQVQHQDFSEGVGEMSDEDFISFLKEVMTLSCEYSIAGAIHYIFMDWRHMWHMCEAAKSVYGSVVPKQLVVWNKTLGANGSFYRSKHELVFIFKNGEEKHLSNLDLMDRTRYNVWEYPNATSFGNPDRKELQNHPTPKNVDLFVDAILDTTNEGHLVIDWFLGSGTSMIASEITGRKSFCTEIEPKYVQSSILRYLKYCDAKGKKPSMVHENGPLNIKMMRLLLEEIQPNSSSFAIS